MIRPLFGLRNLFALTGVLAFGNALAATAAETKIVNLATAVFQPLGSGSPVEVQSNAVITYVQAVCSVSVTSAGATSASLIGGDQVSFTYTITNAGNATFNLPVSVTAGGLTPAPQVTLYLDSNGNGKVDQGEQSVNSVTLPSDGVARLVAVVQTAELVQGEGAINLVASCGQGGDQATATSQIKVSPPPVLEVKKSFDKAILRPGTETTVTVTATNTSPYESREVIITDLLDAQLAQGLNFVAGSAKVNVGAIEYTTDGTTWMSTASAPVKGIRVRVPKLAPEENVQLTFQMLAGENADGQVVTNVATALTSGKITAGEAVLDVHYQPGVAIGPVGNPTAPENTPGDSQTDPFATVGQQVCFDHTVQNTGDVRDLFQITISFPAGSATYVIYGADGQPLVLPLALEPGATSLVRVCYTPSQPGTLEAVVKVEGKRESKDSTSDVVTRVEDGLPELKKTVSATTLDVEGNIKPVEPGAPAAVGDILTYTITIRNPYNQPLTNVIITDPLPEHVDFVSASEGGAASGDTGKQQVSWSLGTLAGGETRTMTIVAKVSDRSVDGEFLNNIFNMTSTEITKPLLSNEAKKQVWNAQLIIYKDVSAPVVTYGDRVTYTLKIENKSETTDVVDAVVTDIPAKGLEYIVGTSQLDGKALTDPLVVSGELKWNVARIPARGAITIVYEMRVTPQASGELLNVVEVIGRGGEQGETRAIASNRARAITKIDPLKFSPISDIVGTVFVDRNRNGLYESGLDTPVERARLILAGGRLALTDKLGRYHFSNVANGTHALRLDPNTTPYPPLHVPQDGGLSGTQTVHVRGLTSVDFPLAPLAGEIDALRRTTVTMGDVRVEKAVYAVENGYVVTLKVVTPRVLNDFNLQDPLPQGAVLKEGRNTVSAKLAAGETTFSYRFDWNGQPREATTDPVVSWRY